MPGRLLKAGLVVAVVDPSTLLGRDVRAVLSERAFPASKVLLFHTGTADGLLTEDEDEAAFSAPLTPDALETLEDRVPLRKRHRHRARSWRPASTTAASRSTSRGSGPAAPSRVPPISPSLLPLPEGNLFLTYDPVAAVLAEAVMAVGRIAHVAGGDGGDRPPRERAREGRARRALPPGDLAGPVPARAEGDLRDAGRLQRVLSGRHGDVGGARGGGLPGALGRPIPLALLSARAASSTGISSASSSGRRACAVRPRPSGPRCARPAVSTKRIRRDLSGPVEAAGRDETLVLFVASSGNSVRLGLAADHLRRAGAVMAVRLAEQAVAERGLLPDA